MRSLSQLILAGFLTIPTADAQTLALVAGGGTELSGNATNCRVHAPFGIDFDRAGNGYIVEMAGGERVLKIDVVGKLSVFAGTGEKGDGGDGGPAIGARFNGMHSLAIGPGGDIFIADTWNNRIRQIGGGKIFAFAGLESEASAGMEARRALLNLEMFIASRSMRGRRTFLSRISIIGECAP
jgi:hypothetical protein